MKFINLLLFCCAIFVKSQYYVGVDQNYKSSVIYSPPTTVNFVASPEGDLFISAPGRSICKYLASGLKDLSFGSGGCKSALTSSSYLKPYIKDNALYINDTKEITKYDFYGNIDQSFGNSGKITINGGSSTSYSEIVQINNDGSLLVLFNWYNGIIKVLQNGDIDNAFKLIAAKEAYVVNGEIIVRSTDLNYIRKFDMLGNQIANFGDQGQVFIGAESLLSVSKTTGDFYSSNKSFPLTVRKYSSSGVLDQAFGNGGSSIVASPGIEAEINDMKIDSSNKILFFGQTYITYYGGSLILRLKQDGRSDTDFNNGSHFSYLPTGYGIVSAKLLNDNKYVCVTRIRRSLTLYENGLSQILRTENLQELSSTEAKSEGRITISPNPVKDIFTIHLDKKEKIILVKLFDNTGRLILNTSSVANNINHLNKGIYFLEVKTSGSSYTRKIIKE